MATRSCPQLRTALTAYVETLAALTGRRVDQTTLPEDPTELSYLTAGAMLLGLRERQASARAAATPATRLRTEMGLLRREQLLMAQLRAVNAPELFRIARSPN